MFVNKLINAIYRSAFVFHKIDFFPLSLKRICLYSRSKRLKRIKDQLKAIWCCSCDILIDKSQLKL